MNQQNIKASKKIVEENDRTKLVNMVCFVASGVAADTAMVRSIFELESDEPVIQNYRCAYWRNGDKLPSQGRLFITPRFACWAAALTSLQVRVALRAVVSVSREKALMGLMSTALELTVAGETAPFHFRTFAGSAKRDEAAALLEYLLHASIDAPVPADGDPLPVLLKAPSGAFHQALLLLRDDSFALFDPDGRAPLDSHLVGYRKLSWSFADVDSLLMRARPLHIDVRFNDGSQRLRFATVHPQPLVVRLIRNADVYRRARATSLITVQFEPGIEPFDARGSEETPAVAAARAKKQAAEVAHVKSTAKKLANLVDIDSMIEPDAPTSPAVSPPPPTTAAAATAAAAQPRATSPPPPSAAAPLRKSYADAESEWRRTAEHATVETVALEIERALSSEALPEMKTKERRATAGAFDGLSSAVHVEPLNAHHAAALERERRRQLRRQLRDSVDEDAEAMRMDGATASRTKAPRSAARRSIDVRDESARGGCCNNSCVIQ
jgi:hypothetical protein